MFPHILFHADRVKANQRRNVVINQMEDARVREVLEDMRPTDGWLYNVQTSDILLDEEK